LLELKIDPRFSFLVCEKLLKDQIASVNEECQNSPVDVQLPISDIEVNETVQLM